MLAQLIGIVASSISGFTSFPFLAQDFETQTITESKESMCFLLWDPRSILLAVTPKHGLQNCCLHIQQGCSYEGNSGGRKKRESNSGETKVTGFLRFSSLQESSLPTEMRKAKQQRWVQGTTTSSNSFQEATSPTWSENEKKKKENFDQQAASLLFWAKTETVTEAQSLLPR